MQIRSLPLLGFLLVFCVARCSPSLPRRSPLSSELSKEKIACHVVHVGNSDEVVHPSSIYVLNGDGSGRREIGEGRYPTWSPDGRRVAVVGRNLDSLYVLDVESGESQRLAYKSGIEYPSWSPDGQRIAFRVNCGDIWVINEDGTDLHRLTDRGPGACASLPSWSPRGTRMTFCISPDYWTADQHRDVYVTSADGSGVIRLTDGTGYYHNPRWSPQGGKIAFNRFNGGEEEILVMNDDGSEQTLLGRGRVCGWSPEGSEIYFERDGWIYRMNDDGSEQSALAGGDIYDWSPDGSRIYFQIADGYLWTMNADGSNPTRLFKPNCKAPAWSPVIEEAD